MSNIRESGLVFLAAFVVVGMAEAGKTPDQVWTAAGKTPVRFLKMMSPFAVEVDAFVDGSGSVPSEYNGWKGKICVESSSKVNDGSASNGGVARYRTAVYVQYDPRANRYTLRNDQQTKFEQMTDSVYQTYTVAEAASNKLNLAVLAKLNDATKQ